MTAAETSTVALMRRLAREHIRTQTPRLGLAIVMMLLVAATTALPAKLIKPVLDDVFTKHDIGMLKLVAAAIFLSFLVKGLASYGEDVLMNRVGQRIVTDLQKRMFRHLVEADLAFFQHTPTGTLLSRFTNDVGLLRNVVSGTITSLGKDFFSVVFLVIVMFQQDWLLASIAFIAFPSAVLPIARIGRRMRKVSANTQIEMGQFTTLLEQVFQGARHVKAYGMEQYETARADHLVERIYRLVTRAGRVRAIASPVMESLGGFAIVATILYGGMQVIDGNRTTGTFFSFITALLLAYEPVKRLANLNVNMQEGLAAAQRIFTLIDQPPTIVDKPDAKSLAVSGGEIRFHHVQFNYTSGTVALAGVDLTIPAGMKVALVGASGAGKSTILNLIPRFYEATTGNIEIDGQDIRTVTLASLRRNIALVSQEVSLFDDTIRANIAYGREAASETEIIEAARHAAADEFIAKMPNGYETMVGEHGVRLSGGQRQRLVIARAMLKDAPILLLDEATSSLDSESERQIQIALASLMRGRTSLVIAHRLSTVIDADLIYVIDHGCVIEQGRHGELLAEGGAYARLYRMQFAGQRDAEMHKVAISLAETVR